MPCLKASLYHFSCDLDIDLVFSVSWKGLYTTSTKYRVISFTSLSGIAKAVEELTSSGEPSTPMSSNGLAKTD